MASETREVILKAVKDIVLEVGVTGLTIDAVAQRAGMSKGGVLYNYRSKDALIAGLIELQCTCWQAEIERLSGTYREEGLSNPTLRALLTVDQGVSEDVLAVCLISLSDRRSELLEPFREMTQNLTNSVNKEAKNLRAAALASVFVDGLYAREAFGLEARSPELVEGAKELLLELLDQSR
ncbi:MULTISPECIES: TetR/AcrR family transcriptional regulator [Pseudovibrio]|uniref:TetR/AcrR family transcriptional regulator n=1 Tax=Stappiaceae TaxID=2821832 RepID=UPI002364FF7A|nr:MULTISPECIES: TetR/AcrR family transcriptional regulator [Pseudovibrio]MDD7910489.1 TetR/AcrR family transcriptional regulator [Pseudovibrio exalbescens]MDX5594662.1 TetR/AcrR family transcriptional regulator [Pseudovibrio sp. SPO723]